jgi:hypothetical protein
MTRVWVVRRRRANQKGTSDAKKQQDRDANKPQDYALLVLLDRFLGWIRARGLDNRYTFLQKGLGNGDVLLICFADNVTDANAKSFE